MSDTKTSALASLTAPALNDLLMAVDVSDTSMAASGTNKYLAPSDLWAMSVPLSVVSVTGATTLSSSAYGKVHICSGTTADYTVGLPTAVGHDYEVIWFLMSAALTKMVTLDGNSSETVAGAATQSFWATEVFGAIAIGGVFVKYAYAPVPMVCGMSRITTPQSLTSGSVTKILLNQVDFDNSGFLGDATNNRINIKRAGRVNVSGVVTFTSTGTISQRSMTLFYKNGVLFDSGEGYMGTGTYGATAAVTPIVVAAGDTIDLRGLQTSGGNMDAFAGTDRQCQLNVVEIISL